MDVVIAQLPRELNRIVFEFAFENGWINQPLPRTNSEKEALQFLICEGLPLRKNICPLIYGNLLYQNVSLASWLFETFPDCINKIIDELMTIGYWMRFYGFPLKKVSLEQVRLFLTIGMKTIADCRENDDAFFKKAIVKMNRRFSVQDCRDLAVMFELTNEELLDMQTKKVDYFKRHIYQANLTKLLNFMNIHDTQSLSKRQKR